MSMRVNLLKKQELQDVTNRDRRKATRLGGLFTGLVLVVIVALFVVNILGTQTKMRRIERDLTRNKALIEELRSLRQQGGQMQEWLLELDKWEQARLRGSQLLDVLYEAVPETVQLTRLSLRSTYEVENLRSREPTQPAGKPRIFRNGNTQIMGLVVDARADEVVRDFIARMESFPASHDQLESITLQRLQRDTSGASEDNRRTFVIEGTAKQRTL